MNVTKEEFEEWKTGPISEAFFLWLKQMNERADSTWMNCLAYEDDPNSLRDTRFELLAIKRVTNQAASVSYEDIYGEPEADG